MGDEPTTSTSSSETRKEADPTTETVLTSESSETLETTNEQTSSDAIQKELDRLKASLKRANAEAKEHREKATELAKFKAEIDARNMSDEEKRQAERQNLEKQLADLQKERESATRQTQKLRVTNEVFKHGQRLNIIDLDAADRLLDDSQIEYDDSGNPSNIEALLKTLVKERSWLVGKQAQTSGGATNPSRS